MVVPFNCAARCRTATNFNRSSPSGMMMPTPASSKMVTTCSMCAPASSSPAGRDDLAKWLRARDGLPLPSCRGSDCPSPTSFPPGEFVRGVGDGSKPNARANGNWEETARSSVPESYPNARGIFSPQDYARNTGMRRRKTGLMAHSRPADGPSSHNRGQMGRFQTVGFSSRLSPSSSANGPVGHHAPSSMMIACGNNSATRAMSWSTQAGCAAARAA